MRIKVLLGAASASALLGVGVLAGSIVGPHAANAQTPAATPAPPTTSPAPPAGPLNGAPPNMGRGFRGHGGPGHGEMGGGFGRGDFGGRWGGDATAAGASAQITNTTNLLTQVKGDLAYATGKMDTTDVQRWLNGADALLKTAQSANSSSQFGQASGYARAAGELARVVETQMAEKLGADKLPSYSQRPQGAGRPNKGNNPTNTNTTITQAQASRMLAQTYNQLVAQGALVKSAANAGAATTYLTDAQNAYKAAYAAYQAGKYSDAAASARLAQQLSGVVSAMLNAASAPSDPNTPVAVPAPNFL